MASGDPGLFGPDSVTWRIHAHPAMLVGGLRALLIQALHPLAMAGVHEHSDYRSDQWGRFRRTTEYVVTTTFGDTASAEAAGALVRRVHRHVRGTDPVTGRPYSADDPELLAWVHNVEVHSFLYAYRRYAGRLDDVDADRYVGEMTRAAALVGLDAARVPSTVAGLRGYFRDVEGELVCSRIAKSAAVAVLNPPMLLPLKGLWAIPAAAALGLVPRRFRAMYRIPAVPPADAAVQVGAAALFRALGVVLPGSPQVREARARVAA
jgi:uncharacterized protein (DUF2236 family)